MRHIFLISFIILAIIRGYGQKSYDIFSYEKSQISATVVKSGIIDSNTHFEKIVLEEINSKIPFYHFFSVGSLDRPYVILLHGLGGNKMDWIYPSLPQSAVYQKPDSH